MRNFFPRKRLLSDNMPFTNKDEWLKDRGSGDKGSIKTKQIEKVEWECALFKFCDLSREDLHLSRGGQLVTRATIQLQILLLRIFSRIQHVLARIGNKIKSF